MTGSLAPVVRRGAAISAVTMLVVQAIAFAQTIALGRLLSPGEIGVYTAGTILTGFLVTVTDGGLKGALIQRRSTDPDDEEATAATVFWATLGSGVITSGAALAAAPVIAVVFDSPLAGLVAAASAGTVFLHALTTVPDGLMQRRFDFRRRKIVDPGITLTFAVVSVALCAAGSGIAGLVIATYAQQLVWIALTWGLARWRPRRGRARAALWRELARFSFPLVLEALAQRVRDVAEGVLVGRRLDEAALGNYRYGRRFAMLPGTAVVEIASYVLFPAFSRLAGEPERLRRAFLKALTWLWVASAPVGGLVVALGEPSVVVLLGERWRGAGIALMAMAGFGLGQAMNAVALESMKGAGRSGRLNWTTALGLVTGLGLLVVLAPWLGLLGVGLAVSGSSLIVGVVGLGLACPVVGVAARSVVAVMLGPTVAALVALGLTFALDRLVVHADAHGVALGLALLAAEVLAFTGVYLGALRVVAPATTRAMSAELVAARRRRRAEGPPEAADD